jgi:hypothetical protein
MAVKAPRREQRPDLLFKKVEPFVGGKNPRAERKQGSGDEYRSGKHDNLLPYKSPGMNSWTRNFRL